ncbi:MAG: DUF2852 domain-containing protein [Hyphomicrobiales bacterium]|nr:DUF2852 domain-containing protein [Hyphomicrobiales bacterium]
MELVQRIDEYGKPAWITLMILGFVIFWPIGLAILGYLIWSKRMGCSSRRKFRNQLWGDAKGCGPSKGMKAWARHSSTSGNRAFDEYRAETMQRLEEEFEEFQGFLGQLRAARDKKEFDRFMKSRKKTVDIDADDDDFPVESDKPESKGDWPPV